MRKLIRRPRFVGCVRGWMPSKYVRREGYDGSAQWFGVYVWEYLHVLYPLIEQRWRTLSYSE